MPLLLIWNCSKVQSPTSTKSSAVAEAHRLLPALKEDESGRLKKRLYVIRQSYLQLLEEVKLLSMLTTESSEQKKKGGEV